MLSGAGESAFAGDLIPDLYTDSMLFDAGNYHTVGYTASADTELGRRLSVDCDLRLRGRPRTSFRAACRSAPPRISVP